MQAFLAKSISFGEMQMQQCHEGVKKKPTHQKTLCGYLMLCLIVRLGGQEIEKQILTNLVTFFFCLSLVHAEFSLRTCIEFWTV